MLIDLPSLVVGGLIGGTAAVIAWTLSRWLREHRSRASVPGGNGVGVQPALATALTKPPHGAAGPPVDPKASVPADRVRLSERILIVLAREGRLADDSPVRPGRTQAGLVDALTSDQSAVSKVLRRLVAAELVTEERRHVPGHDQRLKVYALTRRGEILAREVARRQKLNLLPERTREGKESDSRANP